MLESFGHSPWSYAVIAAKSLMPMQIAFVDPIAWFYSVESVHQIPLGGSQSALCYLAETFARLGHRVCLFNECPQTQTISGVEHYPIAQLDQLTNQIDVAIVLNSAELGQKLRATLPQQTKLVLWTQHAIDQPAMASLADPQEQSIYDYFIFVSQWQRQTYLDQFGINAHKTKVFRNCIAPAFQSDLPPLPKPWPPVLAYTSTPFRGLELLIDLFPKIRRAIPGLTLRVFSSLQVYQMQADPFEQLYDRCRQTPGVEYFGSLPQTELAKHLRSVNILAYPNHFAETSCIAVMEALASGCRVVSSALGALPETGEGFATLVDPEAADYADRFIEAVIAATRPVSSAYLRWQVNYFNRYYNWSYRAQEWLPWLGAIVSTTA